MSKSYRQYCPIAHALDLVGERWSLLIVRELLACGPRRYSDLADHLGGCGTNILAARLKDLERNGVLRKRRLPPPAGSTVYELTDYGEELRPVVHQLAHWGLRSLEPPTANDELRAGWLPAALRTAFPPNPTDTCIEFRIGDERAAFVDGDVRAGSADDPDTIVEGDAEALYHLVVDRDLDAVAVSGRRDAVRNLLATLPERGGAEISP
jgi:DNA-binding HxlR family transcriptional regulator